MLPKILEVEKEIKALPAVSKDELENFRLRYLSRKGVIAKLFDELKSLNKEEIREAGKQLNELKQFAQKKYDEGIRHLEEENKADTEEVDLSLPGRTFSVGREHILTQTLNEFIKIFQRIGFKVVEGPEIEEEFYNFDALNI